MSKIAGPLGQPQWVSRIASGPLPNPPLKEHERVELRMKLMMLVAGNPTARLTYMGNTITHVEYDETADVLVLS